MVQLMGLASGGMCEVENVADCMSTDGEIRESCNMRRSRRGLTGELFLMELHVIMVGNIDDASFIVDSRRRVSARQWRIHGGD